jgi:hypothetical protein
VNTFDRERDRESVRERDSVNLGEVENLDVTANTRDFVIKLDSDRSSESLISSVSENIGVWWNREDCEKMFDFEIREVARKMRERVKGAVELHRCVEE